MALLGGLVHVAALLAVIALAIGLGRVVAAWLRQPEVIGEITVGLAIGPLAFWLLGPARFASALPGSLLHGLTLLAQAALGLFLVGLTHELRADRVGKSAKAVGWTVAGSLVPASVAGVLLAGYVLGTGYPAVRGTAPAVSLVLMLAVSMSITAVPVLARILADRGMAGTAVGRLAFGSSIVIDAICWLVLPVAVGLSDGRLDRFLLSIAVLAGGVVVALAIRAVLRAPAVDQWMSGKPRLTVIVIGGLALGMATTLEWLGLTVVVGAVLAGLAVPTGPGRHWSAAMGRVTTAGYRLVPVFFVVTGVTVFTKSFGVVPIMLIVLAVLLGTASKVAGGYFGARIGGQNRWDSLRIGALMNSRGLTELIVLQAGYSAGILTAPLYLALVVMALVTTALTGPMLHLTDLAELRRRPAADRHAGR
ncbi:cation:proton antiporter [Amycolatopsis alkalitolerans]|uniref:Cation/H(+) antiporter n=1 Tax=Amycolatopsis alkalitolerans TaxID=2547244 RepID=A0A5C4LR66_9PSEU|nr:cation:proton antiporter [Amycolatopsis alkalitolerans]TNC19387.1 cation/H(+) antiporter [Amycolatopsis alkalitolerans]